MASASIEDTSGNNEGNINKGKVNIPSPAPTTHCNMQQTLGTQETCYCCRHYGRSCLQNNFSKELVESSQPRNLDTSKKPFPDQTLRGSFGSFSTRPQEFQQQTLDYPKRNRKNKQPVEDQSDNVQGIRISEWSITYSEFRPRERKRHEKCTNGKIKSDSQQCSKKQRVIIKPKKPDYLHAQVNYIKVEQAKQATDVLLGEIVMSSKPGMALFDSRASHSFISTKFVEKHNLVSLVMRRPMTVQLHGKETLLRHGCPGIQLHIKGTEFKVDAAILETEGIDIILGNNWLSRCKGVIDHHRKTVYLTNRQGIEVEFEAVTGKV